MLGRTARVLCRYAICVTVPLLANRTVSLLVCCSLLGDAGILPGLVLAANGTNPEIVRTALSALARLTHTCGTTRDLALQSLIVYPVMQWKTWKLFESSSYCVC